MSDGSLLSPNRPMWALVAVVGLSLLAGCGPKGYSGPTGTVSGTVTLDGEPVPDGCAVTFVSDQGFTASGVVGAGGSYQLAMVRQDGQRTADIPAAAFNVSVSPPPPQDAQEDYDKMMEASASGGGQAETEATEEVIPAKYLSAGTSGLSFDIKAGPNTIAIDLKK